jgi:hypothetical protein
VLTLCCCPTVTSLCRVARRCEMALHCAALCYSCASLGCT